MVMTSTSRSAGLMAMDEHAATIELHRLLTVALDMADRLDLTMTAIHIDEARNLLVSTETIAPH